MAEVRQRVLDHGVDLHPETRLVGFASEPQPQVES